MPVIFFNKSVAYEPPAGFNKYSPRTRKQKLKYKTELIKELAKIYPSSTPKELEILGEHAEKLLLGNALNVYTAPNTPNNTEMGIEYTEEEVFAPNDYPNTLPEALKKAENKHQRELVKAAVAGVTGSVAALPAPAVSDSSAALAAVNTGRLQNIQSGIQRHEQYLRDAQALMSEALTILRTAGVNKELRDKAKKQYDLAKAYIWLSRTALEQYARNLKNLGISYSMPNEESGGSRRKTHKRKTHKRMTHRRKTHHNRK
jgi:hypothetical protein